MSKAKIISDFLDMLNSENCNKVSGDSSIDELFGKDMLFSVICNKCASIDIEIIGECGTDYGGQTGYQEGSTVIKCNSCGSAISVWG